MKFTMAGLRKAKKYDWKDSNLALFGSDTEKSVKSEYTINYTADLFFLKKTVYIY